MFSIVGNLQHRIINAIQDHVKRWLRPSIALPMHGVAGDLVRSRADLIAENAFLRQQLIVLQRGGSRPKLKNSDRIKLVLIAKRAQGAPGSTIARIMPFWKHALLIVQPDTLLRWHRELFRIIWWRKSKMTLPPSRIPDESIALIRQMSADNLTWGAERIRGELLKLGIRVSKRTVQ